MKELQQSASDTEQSTTKASVAKRKRVGSERGTNLSAAAAKDDDRPSRDPAASAGNGGDKTTNVDKIVLPLRLYNRMEQNKQLTNKKGVFVNMRKYYESLGQDPFKVLPLTFHTSQGVNDPDYHKFVQYFNRIEQTSKQSDKQIRAAIKQYYADKKDAKHKKAHDDDYDSEVDEDDEDAIDKIRKKYRSPQNTWIIKPGENTNRGQGITVVKSIREVQGIIGRPTSNKGEDRTFII